MPQGSQYLPHGSYATEPNINYRALKNTLDQSGVHQTFTEGEGGQNTIPPGQMKALLGAMAARDPEGLARLLESMGISPEAFVAMILERDESEGLTFDVDETKLSTAMDEIKQEGNPAKTLGETLQVAEGGVTPPPDGTPGEPPKVGEVPADDPRVLEERQRLESVDGFTGPMLEHRVELFRKSLSPLAPEGPKTPEEIAAALKNKDIELQMGGIKPGTPEYDMLMKEERAKLEGTEVPPRPAPTPTPPAETPAPAETVTPPAAAAPTAPGAPIPDTMATDKVIDAPNVAATPPSAVPTDATKRLQMLSDILSGVNQVGEPAYNQVATPSAPSGAGQIDQAALTRLLAQGNTSTAAPIRLGDALNIRR